MISIETVTHWRSHVEIESGTRLPCHAGSSAAASPIVVAYRGLAATLLAVGMPPRRTAGPCRSLLLNPDAVGGDCAERDRVCRVRQRPDRAVRAWLLQHAGLWRPIQRSLPRGWRFVATSLCGYGGTLETRRMDDFDMRHEVRVIEATVRAAGGGPVHLVGHSFGGTVALAAALTHGFQVNSLSLFEANPLSVLRHHGHATLYQATLRMSLEFEHAVQAGERDAAARIIDFWGRDGDFAALPQPVRTTVARPSRRMCLTGAQTSPLTSTATNCRDWTFPYCSFAVSMPTRRCWR